MFGGAPSICDHVRSCAFRCCSWLDIATRICSRIVTAIACPRQYAYGLACRCTPSYWQSRGCNAHASNSRSGLEAAIGRLSRMEDFAAASGFTVAVPFLFYPLPVRFFRTGSLGLKSATHPIDSTPFPTAVTSRDCSVPLSSCSNGSSL